MAANLDICKKKVPSGERSCRAYAATLGRLDPLVAAAAHVVPGHGPVLDDGAARRVLAEDLAYVESLLEHGDAELPQGRRSREQRELHAANLAAL